LLTNKQRYSIPDTHPCFAGHFSGNPIVPGVIILNYAQQQLLNSLPECHIKSLPQAKFLQTLKPNESFTISLQQHSTSNIKFTCTKDEQLLATGSFIIEANAGVSHE